MTRPSFPRTIFEFNTWFPDEEACTKFLIESRWPNGFICPRCGFTEYFWLPKRTLLQCKSCSYQVSPTAGTVMHRSKMPLTLWFQAAYLVTTHTPGISTRPVSTSDRTQQLRDGIHHAPQTPSRDGP